MKKQNTGDDTLDFFDNIVPSEPQQQNKNSLILDRWELSHEKFTEIVDANPSLRGPILGYIAETKFHEMFLNHPDISEVKKDNDHNRKRKGDRRFNYKGHEFIAEVKSLQTNLVKRNPDGTFSGKSQVDASDCREIELKDGSKVKTTCLLRNEFDILAVNCYAFDGKWQFAFVKNSDMPQNTYKKYTETQRAALLPTLIPVTWPLKPPFSNDLLVLLDEMVVDREAGRAPERPKVPAKSIKKKKK